MTTPEIARKVKLDEWLAVLVGVAYIVPIVLREYALHALGVPQLPGKYYLQQHAGYLALALLSLRLPACMLLVLAWSFRREGTLREALRPRNWSMLRSLLLATVGVSVLLNALGAWPYSWRWSSNTTADFAGTLIRNGSWAPLLIWLILHVLVTPILEEVVFRFGVLRVVERKTGSAKAGIAVSSLLFGAAHLGYWPVWRTDQQHLVNSVWLTGFSLLLGWLTVKHDGNLTLAIAAHATRNGVELSMLVVSILCCIK